jgi:hypothetical protein
LQSNTYANLGSMSTKDQLLSSALHGQALLLAQRPELKPLIAELREAAQGRDDIRVECAGTIAGWWFGSPATTYAHDLIAAGLLLLAGPVDGDRLEEWVQEGYERNRRSWRSYEPGR